MENSKSSVNNVFLLGAGFTRAIFPKEPLKAPLNKDLFYEIVRAKPKTKLNLYNKKYGTKDIEILLTRLDLEIAETESVVLAQDRQCIEIDLVEYFSKFRFVPNEKKLEGNQWLKRFACEVLCNNDAIVTTNYDCFLEGLLDYCKVWSPCGGYVNVSNDLLTDPPNSKGILIYKIHGSEHFRAEQIMGAQDKKAISFRVDMNDGIFPVSAGNRHLGYGFNPGPYIIAPSFVKFPHVQIADMINKAIGQAGLAQNMIIGGSGLRREDSFLWLLITSFLNKALEAQKKLIIIDPDSDRIKKEIEQYWIGSTGHFTIVSLPTGFSDTDIKELRQVLKGVS